jgi:ABC-type transporter Mla MlaB component
MLRITVVSQSQTQVELKLDGWIAGEGVAVLATEGSRWLQTGMRLALDLEGVDFIDEAGMSLLAGWPAARLELRGGSVYLRMLLERHGLGQRTNPADDHPASE